MVYTVHLKVQQQGKSREEVNGSAPACSYTLTVYVHASAETIT